MAYHQKGIMAVHLLFDGSVANTGTISTVVDLQALTDKATIHYTSPAGENTEARPQGSLDGVNWFALGTVSPNSGNAQGATVNTVRYIGSSSVGTQSALFRYFRVEISSTQSGVSYPYSARVVAAFVDLKV